MARDKKLRIVFISSLQYPEGGAAANRHLAFAKGLCELGNNVGFILTSPQLNKINNTQYKKIDFEYITSHNNTTEKKSFLKQLYTEYKIISKYRDHFIDIHKRSHIDILILLDTKVWRLHPFLKWANQLKIKVIHERTEYPFIVEKKGLLGKIHNSIYSTFILPRFDGIFVISTALKNYFNKITKGKIPVEIVNMIVDPSRFEFDQNKIISSSEDPYLAYCGSMEGEKDGIETLIRAFGKAIYQYSFCSDLKLTLIGDISNKKLEQKLKRIAIESNCLDSIVFTGKIARDKMPKLLSNAMALALARPSNKQAEGGFPTKLGEYLATGRPVIITSVGDIENFLIDGRNSFIAKPNDIEDFATQIGNVFCDYDRAKKIGDEGKKLIYNEFNYKVQCEKLISFINHI